VYNSAFASGTEIRDDDLFDLFVQCGDIVNVRVVRDEKTGAGKGFGYINFEVQERIQVIRIGYKFW